MKVLVLSSKLPYPPKDGGAIATLNLSKAIAANGIDLSMLTFNTKKHYFNPEDIPRDLKQAIHFHPIDLNTGISPLKVFFNLLFSKKPLIATRFVNSAFRNKLLRLLEQEDFKIIQMEGPYLASYLPLIRKHSQAFVGLRAHNIEHEIWERRVENEKRILLKSYLRILSKRIRKLELDLFEAIDFVIPISDRDGRKIHQLAPQLNQIIVPTGIDLADYDFAEQAPENDLFFIGALDWTPNLEGLKWFIDNVFPLIKKKVPNVQFHVAGRNAPANLEKNLIKAGIHYHGETDDARSYILDHGIMVVPILSGSGIRIKILEGMALGKCIVTTTIGAEGIPAENGRHLFLADNEQQFADTVISLLGDDRKRQKLSEESRKLVREKFDNFESTSKLVEFYKLIG